MLAIWLPGVLLLMKNSRRLAAWFPKLASEESIDSKAVNDIRNTLLHCNTLFDESEGGSLLNNFLEEGFSLNSEQREAILRDLYVCFAPLRPQLCSFSNKFNEIDLFCFILTTMNIDNSHSAHLLSIAESSIRSCKTRLKNKVHREALSMISR